MIHRLGNIQFYNPWALLLLLVIPALIIWYIYGNKKYYGFYLFSSLTQFGSGGSMRAFLKPFLHALRIPALLFLIVALARPQSAFDRDKVKTEGIDIELAIDVSTSMLARDFKPNRLEAAKKVAGDFITSRPNDRIGLVVFAGESFTQCPLTSDHPVVMNLLQQVKQGLLLDGTAIGMGIATATIGLKESDAKSKVVILLTDGVNNSGFVDPLTASEAAKQFNVRIYTIGVGNQGKAYAPAYRDPYSGDIIYDNVDVKIDEDLLKKVAENTGGKYFRASNNKKLEEIFKEIDQLEKTKIEVMHYSRRSEEFLPFLLIGLGFLLMEAFLRYTFFRTVS